MCLIVSIKKFNVFKYNGGQSFALFLATAPAELRAPIKCIMLNWQSSQTSVKDASVGRSKPSKLQQKQL